MIRDVDVVICATNSNVPVFEGNWLEPGQHVVTVVGSNDALVKGGWLKSGRRENDDVTVQRSEIIVTNWRESVEQDRQAGLVEPIEKGIIGWDKIHELGEVLKAVYGTKDMNKLDALLKAKCRANAKLSADNKNCEIRQEGETLILSPV